MGSLTRRQLVCPACGTRSDVSAAKVVEDRKLGDVKVHRVVSYVCPHCAVRLRPQRASVLKVLALNMAVLGATIGAREAHSPLMYPLAVLTVAVALFTRGKIRYEVVRTAGERPYRGVAQ